jgi:hypothetical protein
VNGSNPVKEVQANATLEPQRVRCRPSDPADMGRIERLHAILSRSRERLVCPALDSPISSRPQKRVGQAWGAGKQEGAHFKCRPCVDAWPFADPRHRRHRSVPRISRARLGPALMVRPYTLELSCEAFVHLMLALFEQDPTDTEIGDERLSAAQSRRD